MEKSQQLSHVEHQVQCTSDHVGTQRFSHARFAGELPVKEKDTSDLTSDKGKNWANAVRKNKKTMTQCVLSWTKVAQLNKLNHATRANKDWPSRKAHEVMIQLVKEHKPDDRMAEMEMEKALNKLYIGKKKDPNNLNNELSAFECRYKLDLSKSKKKVQIFMELNMQALFPQLKRLIDKRVRS
jgi:hypothetical protein